MLNNDDFIILPHDHPTAVSFRNLTDTHRAKIPGIDQETPWSKASLLVAEQAYVQFSDAEADRARTLYEAFLGEGLVRLHGGSWVKLRAHAKSGEPSHGYGIHHAITDHIDVVTSLPSLARRLGTGSHWAAIYVDGQDAGPGPRVQHSHRTILASSGGNRRAFRRFQDHLINTPCPWVAQSGKISGAGIVMCRRGA